MLPFLAIAPGQKGLGVLWGGWYGLSKQPQLWGHTIRWASHMMECTAASLLEFLQIKAFCSHLCALFGQESSLDGKTIR